MSAGFKLTRRPIISVIAGSKTDATAKVDLAGTYGVVGSAININGLHDGMLFERELANSEAANVKFYLSHTGSAPTSSTGMYQLCNADGTEIVSVVTQNTRRGYPLRGVSGKYLLTYGKGASSTAADLSAFLGGNHIYDNKAGGDSRLLGKSQALVASATNLTGSTADVGVAVDIRGLGNLTLYVNNTGDDNAVISVYAAFLAAEPTATTNMYPLADAAGNILTFTALATELAAFPLLNVSGDYLMIRGVHAVGGTATITAHLFGNATGV